MYLINVPNTSPPIAGFIPYLTLNSVPVIAMFISTYVYTYLDT